MRRAIWIVLALAIGGFLYMGASHAQPQDPFFLVQTPQGVNITAGRNVPSLATTGNPPSDGSLHITTVAGGAPSLGLYDDSTQTWIGFLGTAGTLTNDFIPVWDSVGGGFEDSLISTDGTDTTFTSGDVIQGDPTVGLSVILSAGTIIFEGPTPDDWEFTLNPPDATADVIASFPDFTGTVMLGTVSDNTIPFYNLATGNFVDSLLTDDGTDITLASGQMLVPYGVVGAPGYAFTANPNTGFYGGGFSVSTTVNGVLSLDVAGAFVSGPAGSAATPGWNFIGDTDTGMARPLANQLVFGTGGTGNLTINTDNAAGAGADLVTISSTLGIMDDAADIVRGLNVALTNVDHTGGNVYGLHVATLAGTGADAQATEYPIYLENGWDLEMVGEDNLRFGIDNATGAMSFAWTGGITLVTMVPSGTTPNMSITGGIAATGTTNSLLELDPGTIVIQDNNDVFALLNITGVAYTNHTGTGNFFYGMNIDAITADDDSTEAAVHLDASWDYALFVDGTTQDIDHGITTAVMLAPVLAPNDNASDQRNVLLIDVAMPDGSAGLVNGINVDGVTDDINTIDSAIFVEGGWDSALTMTDINRTATANPLTGTVWMYLTDATDHDGGGNDCAVVFRDAAGAEAGYIIIVNNGVCP